MKYRPFVTTLALPAASLGALFVCSCAVDSGEPEAHSSGAVSAALAQPMPIISRNVPAYASSGDPTQANDASYDTQWLSLIHI